MLSKSAINAACIGLLLPLGLAAVYFFFASQFAHSLFCLLGIVACMETRVRMGYRGRRGWVFASHLTASCVLLLSLILLAAGHRGTALLPLAVIAFLGMAVTGALLIRSSWHRRVY